MKRFIAALAVVLTLAGCSTNSNTTNGTSNSANAVVSPTTNGTTTNTTAGTATGGNNTTSQATGSATLTTLQMNTLAKGILERYVLSHNDKTASEYKVDIEQLLVPGLAQETASIAQSGSDFNHPVKTYKLNVLSVQSLDENTMRAKISANIQFMDGTSEVRNYSLMLVQYNGMWLIRTIS